MPTLKLVKNRAASLYNNPTTGSPHIQGQTVTMASSSITPRRSSRRNNEFSCYPNNGLSKDETAFGVLRQHVLESSKSKFRAIRDPDNVMTKIWIRNGMEREDGADGIDYIKEDGFTVKKYEQFWRVEMAELQDVIVSWAHKLPPEAKAHLDRSLFEDGNDDDEFEEEDGGNDKIGIVDPKQRNIVTAPKVSPVPKSADKKGGMTTTTKTKKKKRKSSSKTNNEAVTTTTKKKRKKTTSKASSLDNNIDRGLPKDLAAMRDEWFRLLERGRGNIVVGNNNGGGVGAAVVANHRLLAPLPPSPRSAARSDASASSKAASFVILASNKERASGTTNLFCHNVAKNPEMEAYKRQTMDPVAKRMMAEVDAIVANRAAMLRNEFLHELALTNYKFSEGVIDKDANDAMATDKAIKDNAGGDGVQYGVKDASKANGSNA